MYTLKNVKIHMDMSDETTCFSATLYRGNTRVATCRNAGQGGTNDVWFEDPAEHKAALKHIATLPPVDILGKPVPLDMDMWISDLLEQWEIRRLTKKAVIFRIEGDPVGEYRSCPLKPGVSRALAADAMRQKYGAKIIAMHGDEPEGGA